MGNLPPGDLGNCNGMPQAATASHAPRPITFQPDIYAAVLDLLPPSRGVRVLDVGAGEGYFSRRLADLEYNVEACDFSASTFKCRDVPFTEADLNSRIPLPDNHFDCTVSIEVIEHLENHFQFMREIIRVTKPGGLIIITTPNILSFPSRLHFFLYGYTDCAPYPLDPTLKEYFLQHINPISLPELLFCYERFGASVVTVSTNRLRKGAWLPMILLYPALWVAIRLKFFRRKHAALHPLYCRHISWLMRPATLMGRIAIVAGRKSNAG